jgi:hypothetical protein
MHLDLSSPGNLNKSLTILWTVFLLCASGRETHNKKTQHTQARSAVSINLEVLIYESFLRA